MDSRLLQVAGQLLLIEQALREIGRWSLLPPEEEALLSELPFCVDTLRFEEWLQWVLLPRLKVLIEADGDLPLRSNILAMGEEVFCGSLPQAQPLLLALQGLDEALSLSG